MSNIVSVIITCYNLEIYIGKAIESVLAQDYNSPFEIIVVDDCSTDKSADIIKSYSSVSYIKTPVNSGVLLATVAGIEYSSGNILCFLDGDDLWHSSKLSEVVKCFENNSRMALVTHDLTYINSLGIEINKNSRPAEMMSSVQVSSESRVLQNGILFHHDYVWLGSAYAVNRKLGNVDTFCVYIKKLPDPVNTYQDWPLAFWVSCQKDMRIGYVHKKLFSYRIHRYNYSGDASTAEKAVRNIKKSLNTMQAIIDIGLYFQIDAHVLKANKQVLDYNKYLYSLYKGYRLCSFLSLFLNSFYLMRRPKLFIKEIVRFCSVQLLGVDRFIRLAGLGKS